MNPSGGFRMFTSPNWGDLYPETSFVGTYLHLWMLNVQPSLLCLHIIYICIYIIYIYVCIFFKNMNPFFEPNGTPKIQWFKTYSHG